MAFGFTTYSETSYGESSTTQTVNLVLTGVQASGAIGSVFVTSPELVELTGVQSTTAIGQVVGLAGFANAKPRGNETFTTTVDDPGSGNVYYINKFAQTMPTALHSGFTYIFDQAATSNASGTGHRLRLSTTPDGTHGGGTEYTTGVTVSGTLGVDAKTTIVVTDSTPSTLYTYCENHSGMGFELSIGANVEILSTTAVGSPEIIPEAKIFPAGVEATGQIGNVSVSLSAVATVTGVEGTLYTTTVLIWSVVDTNQNPNWTEIAA
tara:strand:+ start:548 stop:1342 length:795 start_codon:yes stop_codon:yes gene_type:complete